MLANMFEAKIKEPKVDFLQDMGLCMLGGGFLILLGMLWMAERNNRKKRIEAMDWIKQEIGHIDNDENKE